MNISKIINNKWVRGAIPALLIHCSIGTVYCWSLLRDDIAVSLGCATSTIEWTFSLAIFFLGMSAAFAGNLVEKNVTQAAGFSTVCFCLGMVGTSVSIGLGSVIGVLLSYGCLMGIGLGIGYLTPVKTLMMWFKENKGLATGIAITGFGLAKVIASPIIEYFLTITTIENVFYYLGVGYTILMCIGALLIKKPSGCEEMKGTSFNIKDSIKFILNKQYLAIWFILFLNITCGLALISQEKSIVNYIGLGNIVAIIASLTAALNAIGRFGYSTLSDKIHDRSNIYSYIFASSSIILLFSILCILLGVTAIIPFIIVLMLLTCNAGYGGGFSTLPSLLSDKFGMKNVSVIHGFALSAWAWAGLCGNQLGNYLITNYGYLTLFIVLTILYIISYFINKEIIKDK
jgi:OFA family oxalate/formate antiporter-like MFS transporter